MKQNLFTNENTQFSLPDLYNEEYFLHFHHMAVSINCKGNLERNTCTKSHLMPFASKATWRNDFSARMTL
jgi:hypothetical protein